MAQAADGPPDEANLASFSAALERLATTLHRLASATLLLRAARRRAAPSWQEALLAVTKHIQVSVAPDDDDDV